MQTELSLEEVGAKYTKYQIDLQNKPEWYAPKVNPASKVRKYITFLYTYHIADGKCRYPR